MEKQENNISIVEDKKVIIKPIDKHRAFFPDGHDGKIRYTGCKSSYTLPWSMGSNRYVNIFTKGEQEAFEKALYLEEGSLNLYKRKKSWWSQFNIALEKSDLTLDLSDAMDALKYRVLKANPKSVAPSKSEYNGTQDYYIVAENVVEEDSYKLSEKREEAMEIFMKLRKNNKKMYDLLRIIGKKPPKTMEGNTQQLKAELDGIISQIEKVQGVYNIDDFITASKDTLAPEKIFVYDAIGIGEILVDSGVYKLEGSGQPVGRSLKEVAEYFKSSKNQEDKLLIQQRIELNK